MANIRVYNFKMKNYITVCFESDTVAKAATQFAKQHTLELNTLDSISTPFSLYYKNDCVELIDNQNNTAIQVDFISGALAHRQKYGGGKGQSIAKAIGIKKYKLPLHVLDVTAGLAKDAFVLACLGCSVTMIERHPIIAELVKNALKQAENEPNFQSIQQQGFNLINTDAIDFLNKSTIKPDVIYMDPMYPERKKSASVKKNMQMLQKLIGHNDEKEKDEITLFNLAITSANKRVVVKRPKGAPSLTDKKPSMTIESKITRYDVYVLT